MRGPSNWSFPINYAFIQLFQPSQSIYWPFALWENAFLHLQSNDFSIFGFQSCSGNPPLICRLNVGGPRIGNIDFILPVYDPGAFFLDLEI